MKTRKRVATLFILGALLLSTVTPVLGAPSLQDDPLSVSFECEQTDSLEVTCTALVTGGTGDYTFVWDFGDGEPTVTTTVGEVIYTYAEADTYTVTLTVTDEGDGEAEDTVTLAVGEPSEHIISNLIAAFFIVPPEDIDALRAMGWGFGEIAKAYILAQLSGEDVEVIIAMRGEDKEGSGWGQIMKEVLGFAGLHGYNLGMIVSGREVPAPIQNLANSCGMEVESLTELLQENEAKFATVRMACRLRWRAQDEGFTVESIIGMRQGGMTWREIKEALGLVPERGPKEQDSQGQGLGKGEGSQGQGHGQGQGSQGQGHGKGQGSQGQGHGKGKGKGPKQ